MTSPVVRVELIVADFALIKGIILTLASISGDEAVVLADVLSVVDPVLAANGITTLAPELRDSEVGRLPASAEFSTPAAIMVRGQLFAKVKAFTAGDIAQVVRIRGAFDVVINALAKAS